MRSWHYHRIMCMIWSNQNVFHCILVIELWNLMEFSPFFRMVRWTWVWILAIGVCYQLMNKKIIIFSWFMFNRLKLSRYLLLCTVVEWMDECLSTNISHCGNSKNNHNLPPNSYQCVVHLHLNMHTYIVYQWLKWYHLPKLKKFHQFSKNIT